jgi:hypothetical protein
MFNNKSFKLFEQIVKIYKFIALLDYIKGNFFDSFNYDNYKL